MFNLIPWKRRSDGGSVSVRHAGPIREEVGDHPLARLPSPLGALWDRFFDERWLSPRGFPELTALWETMRNWDIGWEEDENEYRVRAELPGFESEDFDVKVSGKMLTVRAEQRQESKEKDSASYQYGSFVRTFTLPQGVDQAKIDASYHSGVLDIRLPKTQQARGKRIPVNSH